MRFVAVVVISACFGLLWAGQMKALGRGQSGSSSASKAVPNGVWGGEHIRMEVSNSGADLEFDCARGSISQRLQVDDKGGFKVEGMYIAESPANAAVDGGFAGHSAGRGVKATYSGTLSGSSLRLEVYVEGQDMPRTFTLVRADEGHLAKCA